MQYPFIVRSLTGAGNRVRTRDPLITNQVLYQLSYTGIYLIVLRYSLRGRNRIGFRAEHDNH